MLLSLQSGEVLHFPSEINNNEKLEVVRGAALDLELRMQKLELMSASGIMSQDIVLAVGRLDNWEFEAYSNIEQLQPGDVITFGTHDSSGTCCTEPWLRSNPQGGLPPLCRDILQQFGDELGCMVAQSEEDNVTIVTIVRP